MLLGDLSYDFFEKISFLIFALFVKNTINNIEFLTYGESMKVFEGAHGVFHWVLCEKSDDIFALIFIVAPTLAFASQLSIYVEFALIAR
ncbi:MAG: hypothetical protein ABF785_08190 [Acetobacter papayae]|uniref:hypothetical protein n=1 Tax=Acetobacter papayae TaxID=1076592 RepID=UPI0039EA1FAD